MRKLESGFIISLILAFVVSCTSSVGTNGKAELADCINEGWLVPCQQVVDGGAGKDGIPSIDQPRFSPVSEINFLEDSELVLGLQIGDQAKAYPNVILYYHEIVNDVLNQVSVAVTYCPLTGSGIAWERTINNTVTTFGVSGLIHKNNLIAYDRNSDSYWSQMKNQSIKGELKQTKTETVQLVEMTWGAWKSAFPDSEVLNTNTGFSRNYNKYLYGDDYPDDNSRILFPIYNEDPRLERKTLIHGIAYDLQTKVYPISDFPENLKVINDDVGNKKVVIAGSSELRLSVSFERMLGTGEELNFEAVQNSLPVIMEDQEGNKWNIFGEAVSGPRQGTRLNTTPSYNAYWFAWADFFPTVEVFRD